MAACETISSSTAARKAADDLATDVFSGAAPISRRLEQAYVEARAIVNCIPNAHLLQRLRRGRT